MKTSLHTHSLLLAAVGLLAACSQQPPIHGTYHGDIYSAGRLAAAQTTFSGGGTQPLTAQYHWQESQPQYGEPHREHGTLHTCSLAESRNLTCTWTDRFGSGRFEAQFSADFNSFKGAWGNDRQVFSGHKWTGEK